MPLGSFRLNSFSATAATISREARSITAFGNAQVDTAQSRFGGASALFDGNGDYLQIGSSSTLDLSSDYTIECWFRIPGAVQPISSFYFSSPMLFYLTNDNGNHRLALWNGNQNLLLTAHLSVTANTWHHFAAVRQSTVTTIYYNGTNVNQNTLSNYTLSGTNVLIGAYLTHFFNGWIDEYRISNTARYTANFTPSTTPFVNDANTLLLLHMDGTDGSTVFVDDNA